jgi:hypothetical protein
MVTQNHTENPAAQYLFEKDQVAALKPWQLRTLIAEFGIIDMNIDHSKVHPGEIINVSFKAVNTADFTTIYPITLKINYEVVAAEVISLPPKSVMPMKFTISKTITGKYRIDVNNAIELFTVIGNPLENEIARIEGFRADVSSIEADLDINSSESGTDIHPAKSRPERREITVINARSTAAKPQKTAEVKPKQLKQNSVQYGIDSAAECIEKGLDKFGDALIYPIDKLSRIPAAIKKIVTKK